MSEHTHTEQSDSRVRPCGFIHGEPLSDEPDGALDDAVVTVQVMANRLHRAEVAIRELYGSYRSLVAVTGREDAMRWDGPAVAEAYAKDEGWRL